MRGFLFLLQALLEQACIIIRCIDQVGTVIHLCSKAIRFVSADARRLQLCVVLRNVKDQQLPPASITHRGGYRALLLEQRAIIHSRQKVPCRHIPRRLLH
jgi:hypothetical protein